MLIYEYDLCDTGSLVSNNSRTERLPILFGNCSNKLGFNEDVDCFGCYCQPYIDGDKFIIQLPTDIYYESPNFSVTTLENEFIAYINSIVTSTSLLTEYGAFINIELDMDLISAEAGTDCFKVLVKFSDSSLFYTAPYCKMKCDEPSVLICSDYTKKDCNGTIYTYQVIHNASSIPAVVYSNCFRLKGELEKRSIGVENTYDEIATSLSTRVVHTKTKIIDQYDLRIWGVPEWQVERLKAVLGGTNLTIEQNGRKLSLEVKSGFEKGVNVGSLWFPVIKLEKSCQKVLKNC